jgi:hypothetical protein
MTKAPVALIFFNRETSILTVVDAVRRYAPDKLYLIADGPRPSVAGEKKRCEDLRSRVEGAIDWTCRLTKVYSNNNLGCGRRVASGLDYVFARERSAIVLEDDTVPADDFFKFCEDSLRRYENDLSIWHIAGSRFEPGNVRDGQAHLSIHAHIWGWATWSRCWNKYDYLMADYTKRGPRERARSFVRDDRVWLAWVTAFDQIRFGRVDTWDYQWAFTCWKHGGYAVIPPRNLVTNVGFGADATHTTGKDYALSLAFEDGGSLTPSSALGCRDTERDMAVQLIRYGYLRPQKRIRLAIRRLWWFMNRIIVRRINKTRMDNR